MSIFQKGTLTVVIATVIASGMIVLTGNTVADDKSKAGTHDRGMTPSSKQLNLMPSNVKQVDKATEEKKGEIPMAIVNSSASLSPPPGPFLNESVIKSTQKSLSGPVAPKAPISEKPKQPAKSLSLKAAPTLSHVEPTIKPTTSAEQPPLPATMPEFKVVAPVAPINHFKQPEVKSIEPPIWMQKGNITRNNSESNTKQYQSTNGMPKTSLNNNHPAQQYIYVPVPMMPSNINPPQMPVFDGKITPPSTYWGADIMPKNAPNISIQKESTGSNGAPMQKGDN